jgi:hypothetical protein
LRNTWNEPPDRSQARAEREDRRAAAGYVAPSAASSFLALARRAPLDALLGEKERDPVTRAYFRELERAQKPNGTRKRRDGSRSFRDGSRSFRDGSRSLTQLELLLRDAGVIDARRAEPKLEGAVVEPRALFDRALVELATTAPAAHAERLEELAFLANVLISGTSADRTLRAVDAIEQVVAVCERGLARLLIDGPSDAEAARTLQETGADKLFRIGWNLIARDSPAK